MSKICQINLHSTFFVFLLLASQASFSKSAINCVRNYSPMTRGQIALKAIANLDLFWHPEVKLSKSYKVPKVKKMLSQVKQIENELNDTFYKIKNWNFTEAAYDKHGFLVLFPELKNNFDQNFQFYVFENIVLHRPVSPDIADFKSRVYIFKQDVLERVVSLDEWLIDKFEKQFDKNIRLYRTMSAEEASLWRTGNFRRLKELSVARKKSNLNSYNVATPVFHFLAERPILWTRSSDIVVSVSVPTKKLLNLIQSDDVKVGQGLEVQVDSRVIEQIVEEGQVVELPAFDFSKSKPKAIDSFLLSLD